MIKLDTTNGHNKKVIDDFNEVSSKIADSELLYLILTYWADDQDLKGMTELLKDRTENNKIVWLVVTDKAKEIYFSGLFDLYLLYEDNSEALVEDFTQLIEALEKGIDIGIEAGKLKIT